MERFGAPYGDERVTRDPWQLTKETATDWMTAKPFRLAAALAYYTLFSIAPLLVVALGIAGLVFGEEAARGQIFGPLQSLLGASEDSPGTSIAGMATAAVDRLKNAVSGKH